MIETKQKFCINNTRSGRLTVFVVAHSIGRRAERKQETLKVNSVGIVPIPHVLIKTRRPVTRPFTEGGGWISAQGWALRARPLAQSFLPGLKSRRKGPIPHARFNCKNRWRRRWRWSPSTRSVPLSKPDDAPWESLRIPFTEKNPSWTVFETRSRLAFVFELALVLDLLFISFHVIWYYGCKLEHIYVISMPLAVKSDQMAWWCYATSLPAPLLPSLPASNTTRPAGRLEKTFKESITPICKLAEAINWFIQSGGCVHIPVGRLIWFFLL